MVYSGSNLIKLTQQIDIRYKISFVDGIFTKNTNNPLLKLCKQQRVVVVVDRKVYQIYGDVISKFFIKNKINHLIYQLNALEQTKTMNSVIKLCSIARNFGVKRNSYFLGIGGGITTDIVGFAASMYRRKIPYIRIPTTLVGLVDAGVGVKVGVNFENSKNLLGAYHAPFAVFNDQTFLKTLTVREIRCGLYEIIKMGIVKSPYLFKLVENHHKDYFDNKFNGYTNQINRLSSFLMVDELEQNLFEANLQRRVDFGHTFSPYIETSSKYKISHGEAVGLDILISTFIARKRQLLSESEFHRILNLTKSIGFSSPYHIDSIGNLYDSLEDIRRHRADNLNLVIPVKLGVASFTNSCSYVELTDSILFLKKLKFVN